MLRDQAGVEVDRVEFPLPGSNQRSLFVNQIFPDLPPGFLGSLTFQTSEDNHAVAPVTVRGNINFRGEPLFATLDVIDLDALDDSQTAVLPQVGGTPGLSTQIVLVNRVAQQVRGKISLTDSQGDPLQLQSGEQLSSEFDYDLPPHGVAILELTRSEGIGVGYAVVSVDEGPVVPSAAALFQFRAATPAPATQQFLGPVITEAGILSRPATPQARFFVDSFRTQTGVAMASPDNPETTVMFRLIREDGSFRETTRDLEIAGHLSIFADELFPGLNSRDQTLEIISPHPLYLTTLKLSSNERSAAVLTTLPFLDLTSLESGIRFLPQVAVDGGLATRLILIGGAEFLPAQELLGDIEDGGGGEREGQWGTTSINIRVGTVSPDGSNGFPAAGNAPETIQRGFFTNLSVSLRGAFQHGFGTTGSQVPLTRAQESGWNSSGPWQAEVNGGARSTRVMGFWDSYSVSDARANHEFIMNHLTSAQARRQMETGVQSRDPGPDPENAFWTQRLDISSSRDSAACACDCPCLSDPTDSLDNEHALGSGFGVYLHSRESFYTHVDLQIPGRGFSWQLARKYRSGTQHNGILGHNWFLNYSRRLVIIREDIQPLGDLGFPPAVPRFEQGDVVRLDGLSRVDIYKKSPDGSYRSPTFFYTRLVEQDDGTLEERDPHGNRVHYSFPDGAGVARMDALSDRHGNTMHFQHDRLGRLSRVIDTLGRPITYHYNSDGRLIRVVDFLGRTVRFTHDARGDLIESTSPAVTGTPNGNDFPQGKTTRYVYRGSELPRFGHDLIQLYLPRDVQESGGPRIEIQYADDFVFDVTIGGINSSGIPAGGTIRYSDRYFFGNNPFDPDLKVDLNEVVAETDVTDRNGNFSTYGFNKLANVLFRREFTSRDTRPGDPEFFETRFEYNGDGEMLRVLYPQGNATEYVYDDANPDPFQHGNLLSVTEVADGGRSGDQAELTTTFTYEPIYNRVRSITDPRGNDPGHIPQNGGPNSPERYRTNFIFDYQEGANLPALADEIGLPAVGTQALLDGADVPLDVGDQNGDGVTDDTLGDTIRIQQPTVALLPDFNLVPIEGSTLQFVVEQRTYNRFGQITSTTDPEGNHTDYEYYPENDPDGDGLDLTSGVGSEPFGYLRQIQRDTVASPERNSGTDPTPTAIRNRFSYDPVGNLIRTVDGRGIRADFSVNQLNQIVQITWASGHNAFAPEPLEPLALTDFAYRQRIFYDRNDNRVLHQVEDRGNTSGVDGNLSALELPSAAQDPDPAGGASYVDTVYKYDILDNRIEELREVGGGAEPLRTRLRYDPNQNPVLVIQPEGNAIATSYDERDLPFQRTLGATSPPVAALLSGSDPVDYNVRGGQPSVTSFHYDLNRNRIETVDAADTDSSDANNSDRAGAGDRTRYIYDGFDRLTSTIDSVGNQAVTQYDAAGNILRNSFFGPTGGESPTSDGPDLLETPVSLSGVIQTPNLVSGNLLKATEFLYDELSRPFQVDRVLFENSIGTVRDPDLSDGADDIGKDNLTPGDDQLIPGIGGPEVLGRVSTRTEYDRHSRPVFRVEDDGDIYATSYDGADRIVRTVDPEGNDVETAWDDNHNRIETRETDVSQVAGVADETFLTTYFYDSLNRRQQRVDNLGQTHVYRYDSRDNLVAMADASGPDGPPLDRRAFISGPRTVNTTNLFGNVTRYSYDGISRMLESEVVLTADGQGDGSSAGADRFGARADLPPPDQSQGEGDGRVKVRFHWDRNSLSTSRVDDNGNTVEYEYDNLNRTLTETGGICSEPSQADRCDPPTTEKYTWDGDHNLVRKVDENGTVIDTVFDALNRPLSRSIAPAPEVVGTTAVALEYDGLSRLVRAADNNEPEDEGDDSLITFAFDSLGRILEETQRTGDRTPQVISGAWRGENLRVARTYPSGRRVESSFDGLDRFDVIRDANSQQPIADYDYLGKGRVARRLYPINGTRLTYLDDSNTVDVGYDGLRRPVQLRHLGPGDSLLVGFQHTYDRMNNRLSEFKMHDPANSEDYSYDSAYRLTDFARPLPGGPAPQHSQWSLDGVGNWTQVDSEVREHSSFNEITARNDGVATAVLSDQNGNVTDDGNHLFEWDYRNRLRSVGEKSDGTPIGRYSYDAMGRRTRKRVSDGGVLNRTTDFLYDGWRALEERDGADVLDKQYVYGRTIDEALLMDRAQGKIVGSSSEGRLFYHHNSLGSTFALTNAAGSVRESYQYDAYGRPFVFQPGPVVQSGLSPGGRILGGESDTGNPYLFNGRRYDEESGKFYFRFRFLDSEQGRFLSRDPIASGATESRYTFAGGNPPNRLDPMGLQDESSGPDGLVLRGNQLQIGFGLGFRRSSGTVYRGDEPVAEYVTWSFGLMTPSASFTRGETSPTGMMGIPDEALGASDLEGAAAEFDASVSVWAEGGGTLSIPTGNRVGSISGLDLGIGTPGPSLGGMVGFTSIEEGPESIGDLLTRMEVLATELGRWERTGKPRPEDICMCCGGSRSKAAAMNLLVQRFHEIQGEYGRRLQQQLMSLP